MAHYQALLARAAFAAGRYDEGVTLYRKAADANDARAMVSLGLLLETGDHAPRDLKAAYALYEKAADRGSADGALDLAVALIKGKGVDVDIPRALALLEKASNSGSARASFDLAALVASGVGGKPPAEALALFRRAAAEGYPQAYRAAAVLLDEGRGVPRTRRRRRGPFTRGRYGRGRSASRADGQEPDLDSRDRPAASNATQSARYYAGPIDGKTGATMGPALTQWRLLGGAAGL